MTDNNPEIQDEEESVDDYCIEYDDSNAPIVIDNGSFSIFGGYAGDDAPRGVQQSVVGTLKKTAYSPHHNIMGKKDFYVGDEAYAKQGIVSLKYPVERGIVTNWDDMEKLWHSMFYNELRAAPEEHAILLTEHPLSHRSQRHKKTQVMFETFNAPAFYIAISSLLSLYAAGRTTGVVLESGHGVTHSTPCYEGYILGHAVKRLELGGSEITEYLLKKLKQDARFVSVYGSSSNPSSSERETVNVVKESLCYVAMDYDGEVSKSQKSMDLEKVYELPDKQKIIVNEDRFECTEILFKPYLCGMEEDGIANLLSESIKKCDCDIRQVLWNNIVVSGGNTMFDGFRERLQNELEPLIVDDSWEIKVISPPERKYSSWIGGSILASLSTFEEMWIKKEEYDESGACIVDRKCT